VNTVVSVTASNAVGTGPATIAQLTIPKGSASVSVLSSINPSNPGQAVTFTATVAGTPMPTGTVTFQDGGVALGAPVALVAGSAQVTTNTLSTGVHQITALYSGDAIFDSGPRRLSRRP
jgi:hypothetical protein